MKLIFTILIIATSLTVNSQTQDELVAELEKTFNEKALIATDVSIYYNYGEQILDIDSKDAGMIIPLKLVSLKYMRNKHHEDTHYLLITCTTEDCYMESMEMEKIVETTYAFPSKNIVYKVINLIDQLKQV